MEVMRDLAAENDIPVMINIHQVELGKRYAQRVIGMSGGLVVYDGAPDGLDADTLKKIYGGEDWLAT
jgi:phosphonate transport system ATP-binding protein